jgi:hypothetical protein
MGLPDPAFAQFKKLITLYAPYEIYLISNHFIREKKKGCGPSTQEVCKGCAKKYFSLSIMQSS